jgi:hypothetical protein
MLTAGLVNLSITPGLSTAEQLVIQEMGSSTPQNATSVKRKRADETSTSPVSTPRKAVKVKSESTPKRQPKKETVTTPSRYRVKNERIPSPAQRSPYINSPRIKSDPYVDTEIYQPAVLLSGVYDIDCATIGDLFGDYNLGLSLSVDPSRGIWWATFRWGAWDGIIQMNPGPIPGQSCALGWRLRDLQTGQLKFGRKCTGKITFFENQALRGVLYDVPSAGTVEYEGRRLPGPSVEDDLQHEWDAFVAQAYRR